MKEANKNTPVWEEKRETTNRGITSAQLKGQTENTPAQVKGETEIRHTTKHTSK